MTIHQAILYGEDLLAESGLERPRWNAERLLLFALKQPKSRMYAELNRDLEEDELELYKSLLAKRSEHCPLAYIEGTQEFFGRQFVVNKNVLIPRPETEEIVHLVLGIAGFEKPRILDLGSGSGNIAVTLAMELPESTVMCLELSSPALEILRMNSRNKVTIVRGNFLAPPFLSESFHVITGNLPYVERSEVSRLPRETRWEPQAALVTDSLEKSYHSVIQKSKVLLVRTGYLILEFGYGQEERIRGVCQQHDDLDLKAIRKDFRGIPRVVVVEKK